jgi:amino-acid N-acetyltransferase
LAACATQLSAHTLYGTGSVIVRSAEFSDLSSICQLLEQAGLPTFGVSDHLSTFFVVEAEGGILGVAGFEVYESSALVRSLVVEPSKQGHGVASRVCDDLEKAAPGYGVRQLFLLTETAESFFTQRGYVVVPRDTAPNAIATSPEFSELCPQSAVLMRRAV